jgi:ubiquinone/menaquinone biosynthesis C-methylase UbiE
MGLPRKLKVLIDGLVHRFLYEAIIGAAVEWILPDKKGFSAVTDRILKSDIGYKALLDRLLTDHLLFSDLLDHIIEHDSHFSFLLSHFIEKDSGFQKLMSLVGQTNVGTKNQYWREEWLEQTLAAIPAGSRLLDAGAGELQYKKFCSHLKYVGQDFAQYDGAGDGSGLQVGKWDSKNLDIVSDITKVPEPDGSFDAIMCIEVLEHLPNPVKAIKEFARLLRFGGALILTAPFCSLTHFAPYHMVTGFSRYFYFAHLPALGFTIKEITPNGNYFEYLAQEVRRIEWVGQRYAKDLPNRKERLSVGVVLNMLDRLTKVNVGSEELLNFGYFLVAEKKLKPIA